MQINLPQVHSQLAVENKKVIDNRDDCNRTENTSPSNMPKRIDYYLLEVLNHLEKTCVKTINKEMV